MYAIKALKKGDIVARDEVERCVFLCLCGRLFFQPGSLQRRWYILLNLCCCDLNHHDYDDLWAQCGRLIDQNKHYLIMCKCVLLVFFTAHRPSPLFHHFSHPAPVWCARSASLRPSTCPIIPSWSTCLRASRHRSTCVLLWSTQQEATWWCTFTQMSSQNHELCM